MMRRFFALLLLVAIAPACDDPFIDPFANDGRYFSVWGWLDPDAARQEVRVVPVTRWPPEARQAGDPNSAIDARVFFTDLNRGTESEWAYRRARLDDGTLAHVFGGPADIRPAGRYRLEVRRSDGRTAWAETRVPASYEVEGVERGEPYEDADGHLRQDVVLRGVSSAWDIVVTYLVAGADIRRGAWVDYGRAGRRTADGDWAFTINLSEDQEAVRADIQAGIDAGEVPGRDEFGRDARFGLENIGVRLMVLDAAWDLPQGPVEEEAFSRPDRMTNVTGGYGFWGAAIPYIEQWGLPPDLSTRLGWDY